MLADEFVLRLSLAAPSLERLAAVGIVGDEADEILRSFCCTPRGEVLNSAIDKDELIRLVEQWDSTAVEIGMMRFSAGARQTSLGFQVGVVEADPLMICCDGRVIVYELGRKDHALWPVANSGAQLLDALLIAAIALNARLFEVEPIDRGEGVRRISAQCSEAAGGPQFKAFFEMLLGAD